MKYNRHHAHPDYHTLSTPASRGLDFTTAKKLRNGEIYFLIPNLISAKRAYLSAKPNFTIPA
jgi:hypothetical protein